MGSWLLPKEKKCPVCGKGFYSTTEWVYKVDETFFCTWSCLREHERKMEQDKARKKKPVKISESDRRTLDTLLANGVGIMEAADFINVPVSAVKKYVSGGARA